ncbi:hypothetical protein DFH08DRAFT_932632 [Mycena albidolilacea]|uniref:Uncharacterized protein n=1 Tax=Mycena albidolilacea TaxID=1033008 RepID=A0AAD7AE09_9AGAR|nr:hypothetical protein DFH08DRAFT_932632 [Mycena albidolilacea]
MSKGDSCSTSRLTHEKREKCYLQPNVHIPPMQELRGSRPCSAPDGPVAVKASGGGAVEQADSGGQGEKRSGGTRGREVAAGAKKRQRCWCANSAVGGQGEAVQHASQVQRVGRGGKSAEAKRKGGWEGQGGVPRKRRTHAVTGIQQAADEVPGRATTGRVHTIWVKIAAVQGNGTLVWWLASLNPERKGGGVVSETVLQGRLRAPGIETPQRESSSIERDLSNGKRHGSREYQEECPNKGREPAMKGSRLGADVVEEDEVQIIRPFESGGGAPSFEAARRVNSKPTDNSGCNLGGARGVPMGAGKQQSALRGAGTRGGSKGLGCRQAAAGSGRRADRND